jgi:hypothetical protein
MVAVTEGNETPTVDISHGETVLEERGCAIVTLRRIERGFEAPRGDGVRTSPPRAASYPPQGGWLPLSVYRGTVQRTRGSLEGL